MHLAGLNPQGRRGRRGAFRDHRQRPPFRSGGPDSRQAGRPDPHSVPCGHPRHSGNRKLSADRARLAGKPAYVRLNALPPQATGLIEETREAVAVHGLELAPRGDPPAGRFCPFAHRRTHGSGIRPERQSHRPRDGAALSMACQSGEKMKRCLHVFVTEHVNMKR